MLPINHQQQQQVNRPYHTSSRRLPPAPLSLHPQQFQQTATFTTQMPNGTQIFSVPVPTPGGQINPGSPTTPFDLAYATGMLPRQLLVSSPFISSPNNERFKPPMLNRNSRTPSSSSRANFSKNLKTKLNQVSKSRDSDETIFSRRDSITNTNDSQTSDEKLSLIDDTKEDDDEEEKEEDQDVEDEEEDVDAGNDSIDTRTIKFKNLRNDITLTEFLDFIEFGPIEKCIFNISSVDSPNKEIILSFVYQFESNKCYKQFKSIIDELKTALESPDLLIEPVLNDPPLSTIIKNAIENDGATREVVLSNLKNGLPKKFIIKELEKFGDLESLRYLPSKNVVFVNFTSISSAIKCVEQLNLSDSVMNTCKAYYGRDTGLSHLHHSEFFDNEYSHDQDKFVDFSSTPSTSLSPPAEMVSTYNSNNNNYFTSTNSMRQYEYATPANVQSPYIYDDHLSSIASQSIPTLSLHQLQMPQTANVGNRTVYLGNIHPDTTAEEVCNSVRGGNLEAIKLIPEKSMCFLTFIQPKDAAHFFARSTAEKLIIHSRRLRVAWGTQSTPLLPEISIAVANGATRNLYIGVIENDHDHHSNNNNNNIDSDDEDDTRTTTTATVDETIERVPDSDTLRRDFSVFGEIEQINFFKNGSCAFVNFLNILSCMKAVEFFNSSLETESENNHLSFGDLYKGFKISFGKDRCANPPKSKKTKKKNKKKKEKKLLAQQAILNASKEFDSNDTEAFKSMGISSSIIPIKGAAGTESEDTSSDIDIVVNNSPSSPLLQPPTSKLAPPQSPSEISTLASSTEDLHISASPTQHPKKQQLKKMKNRRFSNLTNFSRTSSLTSLNQHQQSNRPTRVTSRGSFYNNNYPYEYASNSSSATQFQFQPQPQQQQQQHIVYQSHPGSNVSLPQLVISQPTVLSAPLYQSTVSGPQAQYYNGLSLGGIPNGHVQAQPAQQYVYQGLGYVSAQPSAHQQLYANGGQQYAPAYGYGGKKDRRVAVNESNVSYINGDGNYYAAAKH